MSDCFKGLFVVITTGLAVYFNKIAIPVIVLIVVMLLDYCTGMAKSWKAGTLSSKIGILGILKKLGYLAVVAVGAVVDWILQSAFVEAGIDLKISFTCGMIITIWLIVNELISILENLSEIGVPLPKFITTITAKLKSVTEDTIPVDTAKEIETNNESEGE